MRGCHFSDKSPILLDLIVFGLFFLSLHVSIVLSILSTLQNHLYPTVSKLFYMAFCGFLFTCLFAYSQFENYLINTQISSNWRNLAQPYCTMHWLSSFFSCMKSKLEPTLYSLLVFICLFIFAQFLSCLTNKYPIVSNQRKEQPYHAATIKDQSLFMQENHT